MLVNNQSQINTISSAQATTAPDNYRAETKIAIHAIRALGAILAAAGLGYIIVVGLQVPGIALLVAGAAMIILGFTLDKSNDKTTSLLDESEEVHLQPDIPEEVNHDSLLDESEEIHLQPDIPEEVNHDPTPAMAFGKEAWIQYIGDPGEVPPLPPNIEDILKEPCPFWGPEKKVAETHMLALIPKTVIVGDNPAVPLTLKTLNELIESSNNGSNRHMPIELVWDVSRINMQDKPIENSHWVLMTKDVLPRSREKGYTDQKKLVEAKGYEVPSYLDAATAILLENIRSDKRLFNSSGRTYTRCSENIAAYQVTVGFFSQNNGLLIGTYVNWPNEGHGIAGVRKL